MWMTHEVLSRKLCKTFVFLMNFGRVISLPWTRLRVCSTATSDWEKADVGRVPAGRGIKACRAAMSGARDTYRRGGGEGFPRVY